MNNYFNIDLKEPHDIVSVIEAMIDNAKEDLQDRLDELEEKLSEAEDSVKELEAEVERLREFEWMYKELEK